MTEFEEQRNHRRFPIRTKVRVWLEAGAPFETWTLDFSDGGLFILEPRLAGLKRGTLIQVQSAEGLENPPMLKARVAWSNQRGSGIEYLLDGG